jgi:hypothetical protein
MNCIRQVAAAAALTSTLVVSAVALAQDKQHVKYQIPAENTRYVQQHVIDAGDFPGHKVRIFETHRVYPDGALAFDGVKVVDEWGRGYSDYTDGSGRNWGYQVWNLSNGEKVFARWEATSQTVFGPDGSKKASGISSVMLTGGTGRFANIRGTLLGSYSFDPERGMNTNQSEGDYWFER